MDHFGAVRMTGDLANIQALGVQVYSVNGQSGVLAPLVGRIGGYRVNRETGVDTELWLTNATTQPNIVIPAINLIQAGTKVGSITNVTIPFNHLVRVKLSDLLPPDE